MIIQFSFSNAPDIVVSVDSFPEGFDPATVQATAQAFLKKFDDEDSELLEVTHIDWQDVVNIVMNSFRDITWHQITPDGIIPLE